MILKTARRFDKDYKSLPDAIKDMVDTKLGLFMSNHRHPSLRVKKMEGTETIWEMRVTSNYRITFKNEGEIIVLRRVGTHDVLNRP